VDSKAQLQDIRRKTRLRFLFTITTVGLYFSFVLNYTETGGRYISALALGAIPGPLVMFALLVVSFILLELLFLFRARERAGR
jgi:uncharacterized membrane protein (DUF485 family)